MPHTLQILFHYGDLLRGGALLVMLAVGACTALSLWAWRRWGPENRAWTLLFLVPALGWGTFQIWRQKAIFDDAFISFRYVKNFVEGHGLVFNHGEYVEGYTNALWVFLVAILHMATGAEIPLAAVFLNLFVYLLLGFVTIRVSQTLSATSDSYLPIAPAIVLAERSVAAFATTGMETLLGSLLVVAAMWALIRVDTRRAGFAGVLLALAVVHRLDHALFWIAGFCAVAAATLQATGSMRDRGKLLAAFLAPSLLILAHLSWKLWYYGDILPNTFYAKASDGFAAERGFVYFLTFLFGSHSYIALAFFLPWMLVNLTERENRPVGVYAMVAGALWFAYLLYVGGDFMYARFCLPFFPVVVLGAEAAVWRLAPSAKQLVAAGVLASMIGGIQIIPLGPRKWGQIEENRAYKLIGYHPVEINHGSYYEGRFFKRVLTDRGIDLYLASCCIGMVSYYSEQRVLDLHGLTDPETAHRPRLRTGVAGHEKSLPPNETRRRRVNIARWHDRDPIPFRGVTRIWFPKQPWNIRRVYSVITWDPELMARIQEEVPEFKVTDFPTWLDGYIERMHDKKVPRLRRDLAFMRQYYFDHNDDPERLAAIQDHIRERSQNPATPP